MVTKNLEIEPQDNCRSHPRSITILGSTGSVGSNTIDLISRQPDDFEVEVLTANNNISLLARQARQYKAKLAVTANPDKYQELKEELSGTGIEISAGREAVIEAAERPAEFVMSSIVGAAGLEPTLKAVQRGVTIGLANKECLVSAGDVFFRELTKHKATLVPVDSEHSAIFQVLETENTKNIERIILTASGGPFIDKTLEQMQQMTPEQAVAHPNWDMGAKISVDSATMMNKGLELIEAYFLFPVAEENIEILVHPQSIIHSMVGYTDGSVLAQLGSPDMRTPIAYALAWPGRMSAPSARLDLAQISRLDFLPPDPVRFPALRVAREALQAGGSAPTVLNAANEVAVKHFLAGKIGFLDIVRIVEKTLDQANIAPLNNLDDVLSFDAEARRISESHI